MRAEDVRYEELGHNPLPEGFPALSPDYEPSDFGKSFSFSATVFGYEIDAVAAVKMIHFLSAFVDDSLTSAGMYQEKNGK